MSETESRPVIRVRGRSFMALVLAPELPLPEWLAALDAQIARAPNFFDNRPVLVDLAALPREQPNVGRLIQALADRGIRIIGTEGAHPSWTDIARWGGPIVGSSKPAGKSLEPCDEQRQAVACAGTVQTADAAISGSGGNGAAGSAEPASLLIEHSIRSGQSVAFAHGDVTVVGSVASGAEIVAGGSIHVYGALRGRAIAGLSGGGRSRIFCRKLHAELLAIEGVYRTADDLDAALHGRQAQAWLEGEAMIVAAMD